MRVLYTSALVQNDLICYAFNPIAGFIIPKWIKTTPLPTHTKVVISCYCYGLRKVEVVPSRKARNQSPDEKSKTKKYMEIHKSSTIMELKIGDLKGSPSTTRQRFASGILLCIFSHSVITCGRLTYSKKQF